MGFSIHALVQIARLYANYTSHSELNLRRVSVQQQNGYHDCGLFSIANATEICMGHKPEEACFDQSKMRKHLFSCLSKEQMQPFPRISSVQESVPRPKSGILNVRLYCICKLPAEYDSNMIECDICQQWFHCSCVKISNSQQPPKHWECPECCS